MKRFIYPVLFVSLYLVLNGCTSTRRFGTTIERDEKNPCQVNMIVQIGIAGTDADVKAVKAELDECFGKGCFISCPADSTEGCMTKVTTVVKKWGDLNEDEQRAFHYVQMVDNDGLPSTAYIGRPNVAGNTEDCKWRRNEYPGTYCHEVLHLCGLYDKYCARIYDPVTNSVTVERECEPPVPGSDCCRPTADHRRCTVACPGHEDDIMGTSAPLKCSNIMDILKEAGLDECPAECCSSDSTFTRPPPEAYIMPGYFHYNDKYIKSGSLGISGGYNHYLNPNLGITFEGGVYFHTETKDDVKETSKYIKATGGITVPVIKQQSPKGVGVTTHLLGGILHHIHTSKIGNDQISKSSATSPCLDLGIALNMKLNPRFAIRVLQADYMPTFFGGNMQHNFRASTGFVWRLGVKKAYKDN